MRPLAFFKGHEGFTLIEAVMVIVLLGIIGAGILMYYTRVSSSADRALIVEASSLAQEKLESVIAVKKASPTGFNSIVSEPAAALPAPYGRFTREVEVFCVNEADLNSSAGTMPNCSDSDIRAKRVRVIMTWPGGSLDIATVISDH